MRLLLDENLSPRLVRDLTGPGVEAEHVFFCGLLGAPDLDIWRYARTNGYTIITRDRDFVDIAARQGQPPKVVLIDMPNPGNAAILRCLRDRMPAIGQFCDAANDAVLVIALG